MIKLSNSSIYEKIVNKGASDAAEINRIGQERAKEFEENTVREVNEEINQMLNRAQNASEEKIKTRTTQMEQNARQRSLLRKKVIIKETFKTALEQLKSIDDDTFKKLVTKLLQRDGLIGNEVIRVAKGNFDRFLRIFSSGKIQGNYYLLDRVLVNYQLKLDPTPLDIDGGLVVIGQNFDIDHSYQSLINNASEQYETEVAKILFDGE